LYQNKKETAENKQSLENQALRMENKWGQAFFAGT